MLVEISLQLTIVYSPVGHKIFGTAPLPVSAWLLALPFALLLFGADEGRKVLAARQPPSLILRRQGGGDMSL